MTKKSTTFKRIALALVAALGFGVLGSGQANAVLSNSTTVTLSASSASVAPGETATVTVTVQFTSTDAATDTVTLAVDSPTGDPTASGTGKMNIIGLTTDSANVKSGTGAGTWAVGSAVTGTQGSSNSVTIVPNGNPKVVVAKSTFAFIVPTTATAPSTTLYTISVRDTQSTPALLAAASFTLSVARNTTATAANSKFYVNQVLKSTTQAIESDSALVVSAGQKPLASTAQTYDIVGYIGVDLRNSSDTNMAQGTMVDGSLVINVSGPGVVAKGGNTSAYAKSVTLSANETATIYSDGAAGTMTLSGFIGSTALTQAAKTVTFVGKAASFTATANAITKAGYSLSSLAADSVAVGTDIVTFVAKDSAGNALTTAAQNRNSNFYCISSDTAVIGASTTGPGTNLYVAASYSAADAVWDCNMVVRSAGTATVTVADSFTVGSSAVTSSAVSITTASKTGKIGTIAFEDEKGVAKTTFNVGDKAIIRVTAKNAAGTTVGMRDIAGDAQTGLFTGLTWTRPFANGGSFSDGVFTLSGSTFVNGVETFVVYMPSTAATIAWSGSTSDGTNDTATAVSGTITVVNPTDAVVKAEVAAATAAADAATDAALQAIDAANAATDAANLAAEAADAATVAAEEAKDAADAATAAAISVAT